MDDITFHQELARLKHQVSQMASAYPRSPYVSQPIERTDSFYNQLHDLKTQLESMHNSLSSLTGTPSPSRSPQAFQPVQIPSMPSPAFATPPEPHTSSQLSLPSGPLFWRLFTSLRTDVRGLDSRVADLEQNLSNLEDRVDNLEPTQFTPAGSEDTAFNTSTNAHDQAAAQGLDGHHSFDTSSALNYGSWPYYSNEWAWQSDNVSNPTFPMNDCKPSFSPTFQSPNPSAASESVAFRDREIAQLDELMRKANESIQHSDAVILEKDAQIRQLNSERECANASIGNLQQAMSERDSTIQALGMTLNEKKDYVDYLESEDESKSAALRTWASKHNALQQSFLEKKTQLCHADRQIQQLQRALYDLQCSRDDEIDELVGTKNEEIRKLREFCDAKEAIVYQQEQIIARGAKLLEDRDSELTRLGQQLKGLDDDYRNETRERARFARLLDERDEEIAQMKAAQVKASLSRATAPKPAQSKEALENVQPPAEQSEGQNRVPRIMHVPSPFATFGKSDQRSVSGEGQWTPKAIKNNKQLPHERRRASVWNTDLPTPEQYKFGVPGHVALSSSQDGRSASPMQNKDLRRSDSLKLLRRLALAEEGGSRPSPPGTGPLNVMKRARLPLDDDDDIASRPPLPARVPPRKMASVNELGSQTQRDGETGHQRPISRHQSIQELSRNRLQPYVEDGASGGDA